MAHEFQPEAPDRQFMVWPYWIARPRSLSLAAEIALAAVTLSYFLWLAYSVSVHHSIQESIPILIALLGCQVCLYLHRLYDLGAGTHWRAFVAKALQSLALAIALLLALFTLFPRLPREDDATLAMLLASTSLLVALRPLLHWLVRHKRLGEGILIIGNGDFGRKLYREISCAVPGNGKAFAGANLPALIMDMADPPEAQKVDGDELRKIVRSADISRIVLAEPDPRIREDLGAALVGCKLRGIAIQEAVDFYEQFSQKIWLEGIHPEWLISSDGFRPSKFYMAFKRVIDLVCSVAVIILTGPLMALIAAAIKLDSPGPVLFKQTRMGLDGDEFVLCKFRSMRQDAESASGPTWSSINDSRITRVGRFLRKFRFDELPQAFNVLKGEMSFVGPRPERPFFVNLLRKEIPYYDLRHFVKPGITGWAQVMYPYGSSIEDAYEKLQYDLYYAKHISIGTDLFILAKTLRVVLFGRGQ